MLVSIQLAADVGFAGTAQDMELTLDHFFDGGTAGAEIFAGGRTPRGSRRKPGESWRSEPKRRSVSMLTLQTAILTASAIADSGTPMGVGHLAAVLVHQVDKFLGYTARTVHY